MKLALGVQSVCTEVWFWDVFLGPSERAEKTTGLVFENLSNKFCNLHNRMVLFYETTLYQLIGPLTTMVKYRSNSIQNEVQQIQLCLSRSSFGGCADGVARKRALCFSMCSRSCCFCSANFPCNMGCESLGDVTLHCLFWECNN